MRSAAAIALHSSLSLLTPDGLDDKLLPNLNLDIVDEASRCDELEIKIHFRARRSSQSCVLLCSLTFVVCVPITLTF